MSTKFQLTMAMEYFVRENVDGGIEICERERLLYKEKKGAWKFKVFCGLCVCFFCLLIKFECKSFTVKNVVKILSVKHFIAACIMTVILW